MDKFSLLLLFYTTIIKTFGKLQTLEDNFKYEGFERCIEKGGLNMSRLVLRSSSTTYNNLNYQWQLRPPHISPLGFLVVRTEGDVVIAVKCGRVFGIQLIPKGGGHSFEKYSFGNSKSVVVDLRDLKKLQIDKSKMTARVGSGWLIGPLSWRLYKNPKLYTSLGICPTVGISGLSTGGGYGLYTRVLGLAADNILQSKIVIANGTLLELNHKRNADLYWALRGGVASNFGIVTEFVFKPYPAPPKIFYGELTFNFNQFAKVFDAFQREVKVAPKTIFFYIGVYNQKFFVHVTDTTGTEDNFEEMATKFPPPVTVSRKYFAYAEFSLYAAVRFSSETFTPETKLQVPSDLDKVSRKSVQKTNYVSKNFYGQKLLTGEELVKCQSLVQEVYPYLNVSFESYGGAINDLGVNETGFVHRGKTLYIVMISYRNPTSSQEHLTRKFYLNKFWETSKLIFQHSESYQNYVDRDLPDYLERYYGANLHRLVDIKKRYDPDWYFHLQQSIPPQIKWNQ